MVTYNNRKIVYSLEYGCYEKKKILIAGICVFAILVLGGIAACIGFGVTSGDPCKSVGFWLWFVATICFCIVELIVSIRPINEKRHDKQIAKWLQSDQIILKTVKPWLLKQSCYTAGRGAKFVPTYKFGVSFMYGDKKQNKSSKHFDRFYKSIEGKKIDILYIPEYDQVLILE